MPLSRLPRHAAVAFVAAAALSAPPAARAADAVYGGTTKDGDPIVVTTDKAGLALRSLAMTWRAACSDGSGLTEAYQLTPVMPTPELPAGQLGSARLAQRQRPLQRHAARVGRLRPHDRC